MKRTSIFVAVVFCSMVNLVVPVRAQTLLRVANPGALTGALPVYLGSKKGIFNKYGLTVEVIATRNEQMNSQALMSDNVRFLSSSADGLPVTSAGNYRLGLE